MFSALGWSDFGQQCMAERRKEKKGRKMLGIICKKGGKDIGYYNGMVIGHNLFCVPAHIKKKQQLNWL